MFLHGRDLCSALLGKTTLLEILLIQQHKDDAPKWLGELKLRYQITWPVYEGQVLPATLRDAVSEPLLSGAMARVDPLSRHFGGNFFGPNATVGHLIDAVVYSKEISASTLIGQTGNFYVHARWEKHGFTNEHDFRPDELLNDVMCNRDICAADFQLRYKPLTHAEAQELVLESPDLDADQLASIAIAEAEAETDAEHGSHIRALLTDANLNLATDFRSVGHYSSEHAENASAVRVSHHNLFILVSEIDHYRDLLDLFGSAYILKQTNQAMIHIYCPTMYESLMACVRLHRIAHRNRTKTTKESSTDVNRALVVAAFHLLHRKDELDNSTDFWLKCPYKDQLNVLCKQVEKDLQQVDLLKFGENIENSVLWRPCAAYSAARRAYHNKMGTTAVTEPPTKKRNTLEV